MSKTGHHVRPFMHSQPTRSANSHHTVFYVPTTSVTTNGCSIRLPGTLRGRCGWAARRRRESPPSSAPRSTATSPRRRSPLSRTTAPPRCADVDTARDSPSLFFEKRSGCSINVRGYVCKYVVCVHVREGFGRKRANACFVSRGRVVLRACLYHSTWGWFGDAPKVV